MNECIMKRVSLGDIRQCDCARKMEKIVEIWITGEVGRAVETVDGSLVYSFHPPKRTLAKL